MGLVHMGVIIDITPGARQLLEAVRSERRKRQHTALAQHARDLGKDCRGIIDPGQQQVCKNDVKGLVCKRQALRIGLHARGTSKPTTSALALTQHVARQVQRDDMGAPESLAQQCCSASGSGTQIENRFRVDA